MIFCMIALGTDGRAWYHSVRQVILCVKNESFIEWLQGVSGRTRPWAL